MARPLSIQNIPQVRVITPTDPGLVPQDLVFFEKMKGLDTQAALSQVDRDHAPIVKNLVMDRGLLRSRYALDTYGAKAAEATYLAVDLAALGGIPSSLRWTDTKLWRGGTPWIDTGIAHTMPDTGFAFGWGIDFTNWGTKLVVYPTFARNACQLVEYDLILQTNRNLANSPAGFHVATFGNRIIVSSLYSHTGVFPGVIAVLPNRVQWSVKNDDNDWVGTGSGFEDILPPSGSLFSLDEVMGVYPVNDNTAIIVREGSIWRMDVTGDADRPFSFLLLTDKIGTRARRTIRKIPGGVIFLSYDDVVIVTISEIRRIGRQGLTSVFESSTFKALLNSGTLQYSAGFYDQFNNRYLLSIYGQGTFCYSFEDQAWTQIPLPFEVAAISEAFYVTGSQEFHGAYFIPLSAFNVGTFTCREDPTKTQDKDANGNLVDAPLEIRTGFINGDWPLNETQVVEAVLEYESAAAQTLIFEYTTDGGTTWNAWSTVTVGITTRPSIVRITKGITGEAIQIRVRSTTLGKLSFHALHANALKGAPIVP